MEYRAYAILGILAAGMMSPAWAAQLDATIDPASNSAEFRVSYPFVVDIGYGNGGMLADELRERSWEVSDSIGPSHPDAQRIAGMLNAAIRADGSQVIVKDLSASYNFKMNPGPSSSSIEYAVVLEGTLDNYVITEDGQRTLIDLGWRALSVDGPVEIGGTEVNIPLDFIRSQEPGAYAVLAGTGAEDLLNSPIIDSDSIRDQGLGKWHFLFDPTGTIAGADEYGPADGIRDAVLSQWALGESNIKSGIHVAEILDVTISSDQEYTVKTTRSPDSATLTVVGFAVDDALDGIEVAGVSDSVPAGFQINPTEDFPTTIIYGMAGIAAVAGVGFFAYSSRALKNEKQGQQGIDPAHLVGYQTSASAGGYQTNRGEAQLRGDASYQQTRNVYEEAGRQPPRQEAACGCAASAEIGSECDCAMQGSCLCDGSCGCDTRLCRDHSDSMG